VFVFKLLWTIAVKRKRGDYDCKNGLNATGFAVGKADQFNREVGD